MLGVVITKGGSRACIAPQLRFKNVLCAHSSGKTWQTDEAIDLWLTLWPPMLAIYCTRWGPGSDIIENFWPMYCLGSKNCLPKMSLNLFICLTKFKVILNGSNVFKVGRIIMEGWHNISFYSFLIAFCIVLSNSWHHFLGPHRLQYFLLPQGHIVKPIFWRLRR